MIVKTLLLLLVVAYLSACDQGPLTALATNTASTPLPERSPMTLECRGLDFGYEIAGNDMWSEKIRHIYLYLEPKAFNEKNLRSLFDCVSKANPEPIHLTVELNTDWSRLPDPKSNEPGSGCGGCVEDPHKYDFLQAKYFRRADAEYFTYSPATHVKVWDFKVVLISGKKPRHLVG